MDGVCADCWGSKGGRPMGWKKQPPRDSGDWWEWFVPTGCFSPWLLSMAALAAAATLLLRAVL